MSNFIRWFWLNSSITYCFHAWCFHACLIKTPTCFKSNRERCIDLINTNKQHSCFASQTVETSFSDFHNLVYTILKTTSVKLPPKKTKYRCHKRFSENKFYNDLTERFKTHPSNDYNDFERKFISALDEHVPP